MDEKLKIQGLTQPLILEMASFFFFEYSDSNEYEDHGLVKFFRVIIDMVH